MLSDSRINCEETNMKTDRKESSIWCTECMKAAAELSNLFIRVGGTCFLVAAWLQLHNYLSLMTSRNPEEHFSVVNSSTYPALLTLALHPWFADRTWPTKAFCRIKLGSTLKQLSLCLDWQNMCSHWLQNSDLDCIGHQNDIKIMLRIMP